MRYRAWTSGAIRRRPCWKCSIRTTLAFNDHYLDVDYDLSRVMFITTANIRYAIPLPLQDRMEIIELSGYLLHDKVEIAQRHIVPGGWSTAGPARGHHGRSDHEGHSRLHP